MTRLRAKRVRAGEPEANPMEGLGNLADAMLVLAVGIMLALIINWRVDITVAPVPEETIAPTPPPVELNEDDMTDADAAPDAEQLQRVGALYYDEETGAYYAITEEG